MVRDSALFYDVRRTYEQNYREGPFGAFAEALAADTADVPRHTASDAGDAPDAAPDYELFGNPIDLPFGIPAGPLLNSRFTTAAFRMGFDVAVYKTVRSRAWDCNPFPNVLAVHPDAPDGALHPGDPQLDEGVLADYRYEQPLSISNSFGVPSRDPDQWQPDMRDAIAAAGQGQLLAPSFQGSRVAGMDTEAYIADHVTTARLVAETGARLMEMNTSCPNEGRNRLLCNDPTLVGTIAEAVKSEIGDMPLIVKLAAMATDAELERMVDETAAHGRVQGFAAINTISGRLVDRDGRQALPGEGREHSGICGAAIREAGLDMVRRLSAIRARRGLRFVIVGVGGVDSPSDYQEYREAGADVVMSATGAMWNPNLAREIREVRSVR